MSGRVNTRENQPVRYTLWTIAVVVTAAFLTGCGKKDEQSQPLRLYAGAGLRLAVEELVAEFEKQTGLTVEPDYGGSGMILARAKTEDDGDLFLPGDVSYVDALQEQSGRVESRSQVAWFVPVILVQPGNPRNIRTVADLARDDVKVALGRLEKGPAVGKLSAEIFARAGLDRTKLDTMDAATVNELGNWVAMKTVDAAIVWRAIAVNLVAKGQAEFVEIPREKNVFSNITLAVMTTSKRQADAQKFVDFMTSEKGRAILKEKGYRVEAP